MPNKGDDDERNILHVAYKAVLHKTPVVSLEAFLHMNRPVAKVALHCSAVYQRVPRGLSDCDVHMSQDVLVACTFQLGASLSLSPSLFILLFDWQLWIWNQLSLYLFVLGCVVFGLRLLLDYFPNVV